MLNQDTDDKEKGDAAASHDDDDARSDDNSEPDKNASEITPVRPKTGEGPDNLKRRSEWFQKRTGRR